MSKGSMMVVRGIAKAAPGESIVTSFFRHGSREVEYLHAGSLNRDRIAQEIADACEKHTAHVHVEECESCDDHMLVTICDSRRCDENEIPEQCEL